LIAEQVKSLGHHCGRRVAGTNIGAFPNQFGSFLWPFFEQSGFLRNAVAVRTAPLGPFIGSNRQNSDKGAQPQEMILKTEVHIR